MIRWTAKILPLVVLGLAACNGSGNMNPTPDLSHAPDMSSLPDPCVTYGGVCKAVGSCAIRGSAVPADQLGVLGPLVQCPGAGANQVCCLPLTACPDETGYSCTAGSATFRPYCEQGAFHCAAGQYHLIYTWTNVSTDIRTTCAIATACHMKGTIQSFSFDTTLTSGSDMANYTSLLAVMPSLFDKAVPPNSMLITIGSGGMYMGQMHTPSLTSSKASNWADWISNGATFP
jgi:hypothetical protein